MYIALLGRETELVLAELATTSVGLKPLTKTTALFESCEKPFFHLGGITKVARVVQELPITKQLPIVQIVEYLAKPENIKRKSLGLSFEDITLGRKDYLAATLEVKKKLQHQGRSTRIVIPKSGVALNAAASIHNRLLDKGIELLCVAAKGHWYISEVEWVQDIEAYTKRDSGRPARNMDIGMVPPKLAQILVNLAQPAAIDNVIDPFCGPGTILAEATVMGYQTIGLDNDPQAVEAAKANLEWLTDELQLPKKYRISLADAKSFEPPSGSYVIVTEGYLGPIAVARPSSPEFNESIASITDLYLSFLAKLHQVENKPKRIVICAPEWHFSSKTVALPIIDQIRKMSYTIDRFAPAGESSFLYRRSDQLVARRIYSLTN